MDPLLQKLLDESAAAVAISHERCEASSRADGYTAQTVLRGREAVAASHAQLARVRPRPA
jgi:hypothetical protein